MSCYATRLSPEQQNIDPHFACRQDVLTKVTCHTHTCAQGSGPQAPHMQYRTLACKRRSAHVRLRPKIAALLHVVLKIYTISSQTANRSLLQAKSVVMLDLPDFCLASGGCLLRLFKAVERFVEVLGFISHSDSEAMSCETTACHRGHHTV